MAPSRKQFIASSAAGAALTAIASTADAAPAQARFPVHFHVVKPGEFDGNAMLATLNAPGEHKQVFQSVSPIVVAPGIASLYLHMQNSMNAYEFSLGLGKLQTLGVLIGPSIIFALEDRMWQKYDFANALGEKELAATNAYYSAGSNLSLDADPDAPDGIYQDWSAQAVLKRGGKFFVCHNALAGLASFVAMKSGRKPGDVIDDFSKNVLPEFQVVPAGVAAVQQAQELGWRLFPIV